MFGPIKKALVVAAVAALGAMAPAVASAEEWVEGGVQFNGEAQADGYWTLRVGSTTTTCSVRASLDLDNGTSGFHAGGAVLDMTVWSCSTSLPGCFVSGYADPWPSPWGISTWGSGVTISGIDLELSYVHSGGFCPLDGVPVSATGALTGQYSVVTNLLDYADEPGLSKGPLGPALVNGGLELYAENSLGGPDWSRPILLQ